MSSTPTPRPAAGFMPILGTLFFLSGAAGLIYEVIWFRLLLLKLGGTGLAVATVTAAFMTGLGLGAWLFGTRLARRTPPIFLYACLEAAIGLYALLVPPLVHLAGRLDAVLLGDTGGTAVRLLRFLLAGAVLLPPTICMGGTLPALARLVERQPRRPGRFVGLLYGLNTTGAMLGAAVAGFVLLPAFGFSATVSLVALVNLGLAALAFWLSRRAGEDAIATPAQPALASKPKSTPPPATAPRPGLAIFAFTLSGAVAFMLQVTWTRVLSLIFASSVYAFSIILVIFLAGLGLGAMLAAPLLDRIRSPRGALAWCLVVAGTAALWGQGLYEQLPSIYLEAILRTSSGLPLGSAALLAAVIMLPGTLALGAGFPMAIRLATGDGRAGTAGHVGRLYAGNTMGAVTGAFATALFLIPWLGLPGVVSAAALMALGGGVTVALAWPSRPTTASRRWAPAAAAAAVVLIWLTVIPGWNAPLMSESVAFWREKIHFLGAEVVRDRFQAQRRGENADILFYRDGVTATVTVKEETPEGLPPNRYITVDGKIDASSRPDRLQQSLLAHLPLLARDATDADVLVIGYASGMTAGAALRHPIHSLVTVEIEEAVLEASPHFAAVNYNALEDPRTEIVADDARAYLERTHRQFDVVASSPSSPWLAGSSKLATLEMMQLIRSRLKPGGYLCQYTQSYDLDMESAWSLLRTTRQAFPHVLIFNPGGVLLVLASDEPIQFFAETLAQAWSRLDVRNDLLTAGVKGPLAVLEYLVADGEALDAALPLGPLNTDDNAFIEYRGPGAGVESVHRRVVGGLAEHFRGAAAVIANLQPKGAVDPGPLAQAAMQQGAPRTAYSLARLKLEHGPDLNSFWVVGELLRQENKRTEALESFSQALLLNPAHGLSLLSRVITLVELGHAEEAMEAAAAASASLGDNPLLLSYRGLARLQAGDLEAAVADLERASREARGRTLPVPLEPHIATALEGLGRSAEGRVYLEAFINRLAESAMEIEAVAARGRLANLIDATDGDATRVESLRRQAARGRQRLAPEILQTAATRLASDGEPAATHYLRQLTSLDPGLRLALETALESTDTVPPAVARLVKELLE